MARREFLQLADKFVVGKTDPSGMYVSEKLDGTRVFWDGGISRGVMTVRVPWANTTNPKTGEMKDKIKPVATGLWSRYGNPISAPDWWLNQLPQMFLDGELFAGRGNFQTLRSIVAKDVADDDAWRMVQFAVFGAPQPGQIFQAGEIKNANFTLDMPTDAIKRFVAERDEAGVCSEILTAPGMTFDDELHLLQASLPQVDDTSVYLHPQRLLPTNRTLAEAVLDQFMDTVLDQGGEGVILRAPRSIWTPKRVKTLLKLKPFTDDCGTLTGFVSGRETDKGSKLRGLIGALILDYNGKRLELSGMTNEERRFEDPYTAYAYMHPGEDMPNGTKAIHFKVGDSVEFRYRELSDDLIPKEGRYHRAV
jgi:DNA ligase-1